MVTEPSWITPSCSGGQGWATATTIRRTTCRITLVGGGCGKLRGGRHLQYKMDTPFMNLALSLLDKVDVHLDSLADSTGRLTEV